MPGNSRPTSRRKRVAGSHAASRNPQLKHGGFELDHRLSIEHPESLWALAARCERSTASKRHIGGAPAGRLWRPLRRVGQVHVFGWWLAGWRLAAGGWLAGGCAPHRGASNRPLRRTRWPTQVEGAGALSSARVRI